MSKRRKLSRTMSEREFVNGYWYAAEIKAFAKELGVSPVSKLRKDELEELILTFLRTGKVCSAQRKPSKSSGVKDSDRGLQLEMPIGGYTNNSQTKQFLLAEAKKADSKFKLKSGAMYRLNRWREQQLAQRTHVTYRELVQQLVVLCQTQGSFPQAPSGRYINFLSDFLKGEKQATREQALAAWADLKRLDIPKSYSAWKKLQKKTQ